VRPVWDVERIRLFERECGVPEGVLIDRASTAVARRASQLLGRTYGARVLVVAGTGHNGADALWAGARLADRGADVDVALPLGEPRDEHGLRPLRRLRRRVSGMYDLVIDGVLGVGARAFDERPPWASLLEGANVLAVDLPTGVDADTGAVGAWAVRAAVTVTFGGLKPGLVVGAGADHAGLVEVRTIGMFPPSFGIFESEPTSVLDGSDVAAWLGPPAADTDKYRRGVVGVWAGSAAYPGAAALAVRGAQRTGCGYVRLVAPRAVADAVRAAFPEVVAAEPDGDLPRADVWVVGPGLGEGAEEAVARVLVTDLPVVVDADGLRGVTGRLDRSAATVLTPHTGEFERLTGVARADAERDRIGVARRASRDLGATVLLKGTTTVVADDGAVLVNPTGTPWLATAGTGDVLSGAIGALLARGLSAPHAAAGAAWLHGLAARLAAGDPPAAVTAMDVAEALPAAARIALGG
jgi:hydroxyethylthiazole kinase-like uncharacterized protein yjeF